MDQKIIGYFVCAFCIILVALVAVYQFAKLFFKISESSKAYKTLRAHYNKTIGKVVPEKTTMEASNFFSSDEYMIAAGINPYHLRSTANALVGLGIFGTFLGLSIALAQNINFDEAHITESIYSLLGGMNTAFYSSVAGMLTSIAFGFFYRKKVAKLEKQIKNWCDELDSQYLITPMELLARQTEAIELMGNNIGSSIGTQIVQQMESTMKELMAMVTENIKEQMLIAGESMQHSAEEMNDAAELVKQASADFSASTKNMKTLMGDIENIVKKVGYMSTSIAKCQSKYDETIETLETVTTQFKEDVVSTFSTIEKSVSSVSAKLEDSFNSATISFQSAMESTMGEIGDATNQFQGAIVSINETMAGFEDNIKGINDMMKSVETIISSVFLAVDEQSKGLVKINKVLADLAKMQSKIEDAQNKYNDNFARAMKALETNIAEIPNLKPDIEKIFTSINAGLNQYIEVLRAKTGDLIGEFTKQFTASCESINGTAAQLTASVEHSTTQMVESVQKSAMMMNDAAQKLTEQMNRYES